MDIFQGTISNDHSCRPFLENDKPAGLLFYKKTDAEGQFIFMLVTFAVILFDLALWYLAGFVAFAVAAFLSVVFFFYYTINSKNEDLNSGLKYYLKDIQEVKVLDNDTALTSHKDGSTSLASAAVGGALFGGAGAVVGSVAGGNKIHREQTIQVGVKFVDGNWVVLSAKIDDSMLGQVTKSNVEILMQMTSSKQVAPF